MYIHILNQGLDDSSMFCHGLGESTLPTNPHGSMCKGVTYLGPCKDQVLSMSWFVTSLAW